MRPLCFPGSNDRKMKPATADCPKNTPLISSCPKSTPDLLLPLWSWLCFCVEGGERGKGLFGEQLLCSAQLMKEEMFPAKKRDLGELQASWAAEGAPGSRAGILELRDEGNLRLTQGKAGS